MAHTGGYPGGMAQGRALVPLGELPSTGADSGQPESDQSKAEVALGETDHTEAHSVAQTVADELGTIGDTLSDTVLHSGLPEQPEDTHCVPGDASPSESAEPSDTITQLNTEETRDTTDDNAPTPQSDTQKVLTVTRSELETIIRSIVREELATPSTDRPPLELRPVFKRGKGVESIARSIRLNKAMVEMAEEKAKQDRAQTGGNFNGLVEFLVWEYLGRPGEFVE